MLCLNRICTDPRGRKYAQQVQCARVYHINVVLRIRTSTQDRVSDRAYREKSMQIQRHASYLPLVCTHQHIVTYEFMAMFLNAASVLPYQMSDLPSLCTAVVRLSLMHCFCQAQSPCFSAGMYHLSR